MYHVSAQGVDERMINVHYYYYYDTEITLEGDTNSFEDTVKTINTFGKASGLFLNAGKTSAIWLGNKRNSLVKYMPHLQMGWNPPKFKILGITT